MEGHDGVASYSWLGGLDPIPDFKPLLQMASGVYLTCFGSFVFGTPGFPLSNVPLQQIAADAAAGRLDVKPTRISRFGRKLPGLECCLWPSCLDHANGPVLFAPFRRTKRAANFGCHARLISDPSFYGRRCQTSRDRKIVAVAPARQASPQVPMNS